MHIQCTDTIISLCNSLLCTNFIRFPSAIYIYFAIYFAASATAADAIVAIVDIVSLCVSQRVKVLLSSLFLYHCFSLSAAAKFDIQV